MKCMARDDEDLIQSQDMMWKKGFFDYAKNGVNGTQEWGKGDEKMAHEYAEGKSSGKQFGDVLVYEPCNYVSNVAYYRAVMRICDYEEWKLDKSFMREIKRSFSVLAFGSALDHASHTDFGNEFHDRATDIILYLTH